MPVSLLPQIAETLAISLEELIGKKDVQPAKRGPAPKLQQQIERIQRLPRAKQRFVIEILDTVLAQASRSILILRGQRVILDRELAAIYGSTTKRLNEQIKRNRDRFPEDFMFQLTAEEAERSRSQIAALKSGRGQNIKYRPYARIVSIRVCAVWSSAAYRGWPFP